MFGCVSDQVLVTSPFGGDSFCAYNLSSACNFAVAIGVISFLICLALLVKDVMIIFVSGVWGKELSKLVSQSI